MIRKKMDFCSVAVIAMLAFGIMLDGADKRDEAFAAELRAASESGDTALAQITGSRLTIRPFGLPMEERRLNSRFVASRFSATGLEVFGLGYTTVEPTLSANPSVLICDRHGVSLANAGPVPAVKDVSAIAVAPDGKKVAVVGRNARTVEQVLQLVWLGNAGVPLEIERASESLADQFTWSPDSSQIAFSVNNQIRVFNLNDGTYLNIAHGTEPSWSPDGSRIAFLTPDARIAIYDVAARSSAALSQRFKSVSSAIWAPNSKWFAVAEAHDGEGANPNCYSNNELAVYRIADMARAPALNLCGLKPRLFGWILHWREWGITDQSH